MLMMLNAPVTVKPVGAGGTERSGKVAPAGTKPD